MTSSEGSSSAPASVPTAPTSGGSSLSYDDVLAEAEAMPLRPDWNTYFMGIARAVAARADCRRRKIGCVIVDEAKRIVSTGYNGAPSGAGSCLAGDCPRGLSNVPSFTEGNQDHSDCISLHAEQNAIAWGDRSRMQGATIYIYQLDLPKGESCPPCNMCGKLLSAAGIDQVCHL